MCFRESLGGQTWILDAKAIPIWCFVSRVRQLNILPLSFINVNFLVWFSTAHALFAFHMAIICPALPSASWYCGHCQGLSHLGDGGPAVDKCGDKAGECCASITYSFANHNLGYIWLTIGEGGKQQPGSKFGAPSWNCRGSHYFWSCCLDSACGTTQCVCFDSDFCDS